MVSLGGKETMVGQAWTEAVHVDYNIVESVVVTFNEFSDEAVAEWSMSI